VHNFSVTYICAIATLHQPGAHDGDAVSLTTRSIGPSADGIAMRSCGGQQRCHPARRFGRLMQLRWTARHWPQQLEWLCDLSP